MTGGISSVCAEEPPRVRLELGVVSERLHLDGVLDEPAWASVASIDNLTMVEPRQGGATTGSTEVKVIAEPRALVFGIRCLDPEPSLIVSFTRERDGALESEDHVVILLDPFLDGRSGYVFAVNPGGARFDGLVQPGGEDVDKSWDGEWEAAVRRDELGWTAEVRVSIATLRFRRGLSEWGFNVQRRVQRVQETDRWASPSPDFSPFQPSRAGLLAGVPQFDLGAGLSVRPSLVGGSQSQGPDTPGERTFEPSLDLTQRLGTNALASLTVNTDFAETEVDTRQVNLTRFSLFFPEKRTFFLDGADIFSFGTGIGGGSVVPFFSRRIGLVDDREVTVRGGVKATGRVGQTSFGGLVVHTGALDGVAPATTMGVVRVERNVWAESRTGFLATVGDPLGRPDSWEFGADFTFRTSRFRGDKNLSAGAWALATGRSDLVGFRETTALGFKLDYPNDLWDCALIYHRIGDGFDPSLGFVPRRGVNTFAGGCTYAPRLNGTFIRQMFHEFEPSLTTDLGGRWESYQVFMAPINWRLESGDRFEFNVVPAGERLGEPFEIVDGVTIESGAYHWMRYRLEAGAAAKRKLSGQATWWFGGFYTGKLDQIELEAAWTPSPLVTLLVNAEHDRGRLDQGSFDITLVGTKVRLNMSPDLQFNCFLQYDTEERVFGTNTRLRWTFHPRGDLFVIYNHGLREIQDRWQRESNELLVKLQYTFRP
jgi:hypothetical protein